MTQVASVAAVSALICHKRSPSVTHKNQSETVSGGQQHMQWKHHGFVACTGIWRQPEVKRGEYPQVTGCTMTPTFL